MSTPSDPRPTGEQDPPAQPTTREIPIVPPAASAPSLPPHPGAISHAPVDAAGTAPARPAQGAPSQPTGPVDFVPGLSGLGTPPPPPPATPVPVPPSTAASAGATAVSAAPTWPDTLEPEGHADRRSSVRPRRHAAAFAGIGLAVLGLVLLELGLLLDFGTRSLWSTTPLWSAFATLSALFALLVFGAGASTRSPEDAASGVLRRAAVGGGVGVAVFWLLVVLPDAAGNRGFVLTAATACLGAGLVIGASRTP